MTRWRLILAAALTAAALTTTTGAQNARLGRPANPGLRALQPAARVQRVLDNGLAVLCERHASVPVVSATLLAPVPAVASTASLGAADSSEMALVLSGLLGRSVLDRSTAAGAEAARLGALVSVSVDQGHLTVVVRGMARSTGDLLGLLKQVVETRGFRDDQVTQERMAAAQALRRSRSIPRLLAEQIFLGVVQTTAPAEKHTSASLNGAAVDAFAASLLHPSRARLILVGDIDPAGALAAAGRQFSSWNSQLPSQGAMPALVGSKRGSGGAVLFIDRPGSAQATLTIGVPGPPAGSPESIGFEALNMVYGGYTNSRLFRRLVQERGWAYGPQSVVRTAQGRTYLFAAAETQNATVPEVAREMVTLMDGLAAEPIASAEVEPAVSYLRGLWLFPRATAAARSQQLATAARNGVEPAGLDAYDRELALLTPATLHDLARSTLVPTRRTMVVIGDYTRLGPQLTFLGPIQLVNEDGRKMEAAPAREVTATEPADDHDRRRFGSGRMLELARLARAGDESGLANAVRQMVGQVPLVEKDPLTAGRSIVTFLYLGSTDVVGVNLPELRAGSVPFAQDPSSAMPAPRSVPTPFQRLHRSNVWYLRLNLPDSTLMGYSIGVERQRPAPNASGVMTTVEDQMLDPLNHEVLPPGRASLLRLAAAPPQPWIVEHPEVPKGRTEKATIESVVLGGPRQLSVYLPAGQSASRKTMPVVYIFDGEWFASELKTPTVLDNLIHTKRIPPMVAVFVEGIETRNEDLVNSTRFARFLAEELHPWVRSRFRVSGQPRDAALAGASFGGLAAAFVALHHPDQFGKVISLSGAFWPPAGWSPAMKNWETLERDSLIVEEYVRAPRRELSFYMDCGFYESAMLVSNRALRSVLRAKGYPVTYVEQPGTHHAVYWRNSIGDGLIALFGKAKAR